MPISWQTLFAIGCGGFLGAVARAYSVHLSNKYIPFEFPVGILIVNIIGSFIIGILIAYFSINEVQVPLKGFLVTGFLGALTTYSTFAIETVILLESSVFLAILNMVLNLFGTVIFAGIGYKLTLFFIKT